MAGQRVARKTKVPTATTDREGGQSSHGTWDISQPRGNWREISTEMDAVEHSERKDKYVEQKLFTLLCQGTASFALAPLFVCGKGELVGGVHILVGGVVQVYHVLPELEEEDKGREEVQEIERESQGEENHSHGHDNGYGMKDSNILSHGVCADDVKLKTKEMRLCAQTMRALSGSQWKWSVVHASCSANHTFCH